jgi:hypothetical protein
MVAQTIGDKGVAELVAGDSGQHADDDPDQGGECQILEEEHA